MGLSTIAQKDDDERAKRVLKSIVDVSICKEKENDKTAKYYFYTEIKKIL